jgi:cell division protein FtsQ
MAFESVYSSDDYSSAPLDEYQNAAASRKIEKGMKRLLFFTGIVITAGCVWFLVISPLMPFSNVDIKGFSGFEGSAVLQYAGLGEGASFAAVNVLEVEKILAGHHLVESVKVVKTFPDRLSIFLEPRRAVAMSLAEINGRLLPVCYDQHGVILKIGGAPEKGLPLISGLVFEKPVPGMRLPAVFTPFLAELAKIETDAKELLEAVSEMRIIRKPYNGFDIMLYPEHNPVRIRLGNTLNEDTLRYVLLMLDVAGSWKPVPDEIDFRQGIGAYKVKEAHLGE